MTLTTRLGRKVSMAVLTISDSRTIESDKGGNLTVTLAKQASIEVVKRAICKDEEQQIKDVLIEWYNDPTIDCIITTGGTGVAKRDVSIEAISTTFTKEMAGFGELFRYISYTEDVGSKVMLSRAMAGIAHDKVVFVLPGSTKAIKLAMTKLILPEIEHIVYELTK